MALAAFVSQVVVGVSVSSALARLEEALSGAVGIRARDGVDAGTALHLRALSAGFEELNVAAGDWVVRAGANDRDRVAVDIRDVNIGKAVEGALDLGASRVVVLANGNTASPSGRIDDGSGRGKHAVGGATDRTGTAGVISVDHGQRCSVLVFDVDG